MDIWNAPVGTTIDLGELPAEADPTGLGQAATVLNRLDQLFTRPGEAPPENAATAEPRITGISWHPRRHQPGPARLTLTVVARSTNARRVALRVHAIDGASGAASVLADLTGRRTPAAATTPTPTDALLTTPVRPGDRTQRDFEVDARMLTDHVPGAVPVMTTPTLIRLIEDTAADVLRPRFVPGAASLGTWIGVRHTGAATLGDRVRVSAVVADVRGRQIIFDVRAWVGEHRPVGDGQVTQTLIRASDPRPTLIATHSAE